MDETKTNSMWGIGFMSMRQRLDDYYKQKELAKQSVWEQNVNNSFNSMQNLQNLSLTAKDNKVQEKSNKLLKVDELVMEAKNYATTQWKNWDNANTWQIMNTLAKVYWQEFKDRYQAYMNNSKMDWQSFARWMWWREQEQAPQYEYQWNFLTEFFKPIFNTSASLATKLDERNNTLNEIKQKNYKVEWVDYDYEYMDGWAFSQYLYDKYGRVITLDQDILEEEQNYVNRNPQVLDRFKNPNKSSLWVWEWALDIAFTITAPWIKALLMGMGETETWWKILNVVWEVISFWWSIVNKLPWLKQFRDGLDEEDQARFDALVGNTILYAKGKTKIERAEKAINPKNMIKRFNEIKTEKPNANIKDISNSLIQKWWSKLVDGKVSEQKVNETAWKIVKWRNVKDQMEATNALAKIDTEWVKTYSELAERLQKWMDDIMNKENEIYSKDTRTYKPEDTRSTMDVKNAWQTTTVNLTPVEDAINLLKEMYEWDQVQMAWLENLIKKFETEWLTRWEINNLSKAISSKSNSYNAKNELKKTKSAQDVERIRRNVKEFARQWDEELISLDKDYWNIANTKELVNSVSEEVLRAKENLANRNLLQKVWWLVWEILNIVWWKQVISKLLPKLVWDEKMSALTREKQLNANLKKFQRMSERLSNATTEAEVKTIVEEFNTDLKLVE